MDSAVVSLHNKAKLWKKRKKTSKIHGKVAELFNVVDYLGKKALQTVAKLHKWFTRMDSNQLSWVTLIFTFW